MEPVRPRVNPATPPLAMHKSLSGLEQLEHRRRNHRSGEGIAGNGKGRALP